MFLLLLFLSGFFDDFHPTKNKQKKQTIVHTSQDEVDIITIINHSKKKKKTKGVRVNLSV